MIARSPGRRPAPQGSAIEGKIRGLGHGKGGNRQAAEPGRPDIIDIRGNRDDRPFGRQDPADEIEELGCPVADDYQVFGNPLMVGNRLDELTVFRIGIVDKVFQLAADERTKPFRGAERIDIGAEIKDPSMPFGQPPEDLVDIAAMFEIFHDNQIIALKNRKGGGKHHRHRRFAQFTDRAEGVAGRTSQFCLAPPVKKQ